MSRPGDDDCACAGGARQRTSTGHSGSSSMSEYDPERVHRAMSNVNPRDLYHITVGDSSFDSQDSQNCERKRVESWLKNVGPPCIDHFGNRVNDPTEVRMWDARGRPRLPTVHPTVDQEPLYIDYTVKPSMFRTIETPEYQPAGVCDRMKAWCSHTFCNSCQNPYSQMNESAEEGAFDWGGQQPMVISEPIDWHPKDKSHVV